MKAYGFDSLGRYIGVVNCQLDPVRSKKVGHDCFLIPANATKTTVPEYDAEKEIPVWNGSAWTVEALPEHEHEPEPVEPEPTQLDRVEAQVTYTAMMTDTLLEV